MRAARRYGPGVALLLAARIAVAQEPASPDSAASTPVTPVARVSWTSDRFALHVGEILTVVVDEQTAARERVSQVAVGNRSQKAAINAGALPTARIGPEKTFGSGMESQSRDVGEAGRQGDLTAVLGVRVTAIEPGGIAKIQGTRKVTVDGRLQEISLEGVVRPQDVSSDHIVYSSRIAEAVITYKGKKIGPRTGIAGRILSMLWP